MIKYNKRYLFSRISQIKNKKAGLTDLFLLIIIAFIIILISGIFIYIGGLSYSKVQEVMGNQIIGDVNTTNVIDNTIGAVNNSYQSLRWISMMLIVGMIISIFIGSYLVTTKPVFIIPYTIITFIAIIVAVGIELAYEQITQDATLGSTFASFTMSNFFMQYLPFIVGLVGVVGGIIMFSRMGSKENQIYGGNF